jgi:hypothetical protein
MHDLHFFAAGGLLASLGEVLWMSAVRSWEIGHRVATGDILILRRRGWPNAKESPFFFPGFAEQTLLEVFRRLMRAALVESIRVPIVRRFTDEGVSTNETSVVW